MPNEKVEDIPLMKVCSVWLYFDGADYSRIKLWSQIICCSEAALKLSMKHAAYLHNSKNGIENDDAFLKVIYDEMKNLTTDGMKVVFNGMRGK